MKKIIVTLFVLFYSCLIFSQDQHIEQQYISYGDLIHSINEVIENELMPSDILMHEFQVLQQSHGISGSDKMYSDFVRVRTAFEATRDSGLWGIRWAVTHKEPNSDLIWQQWNRVSLVDGLSHKQSPTAIAECDELSALFAIISRELGVTEVGLFWPTSNHTVAVWTAEDPDGDPVRVVIPTSQIFLSANASLGTKEFDPYKQKTIYKYRRKDVASTYQIPKSIALMMVEEIKRYGSQASSVLQALRNKRSQKFGGS